jgi:hypothetical protein
MTLFQCFSCIMVQRDDKSYELVLWEDTDVVGRKGRVRRFQWAAFGAPLSAAMRRRVRHAMTRGRLFLAAKPSAPLRAITQVCWESTHKSMCVAALVGLSMYLTQAALLPSGTYKETVRGFSLRRPRLDGRLTARFDGRCATNSSTSFSCPLTCKHMFFSRL